MQIAERFTIYKSPHGSRNPWYALDSMTHESEGVACFSSKKKAITYACSILLQDNQSIWAEAYREQRRQLGEEYSYRDALDALIHYARYDSNAFIEMLPGLMKLGEGRVTFDVVIEARR